MKTMKKGDEMVRVKDPEVKAKLADGWAFCKKELWKKIHGKKQASKPVGKPLEKSLKPVGKPLEETPNKVSSGKKGEKTVSKYRAKQANN